MRIIWITYFGSWTEPLAELVAGRGSLAVIIPSDKTKMEIRSGITYYYIPYSTQEATSNMTPQMFQKFKDIIDVFQPDIIHVHGTEKNLGQIQRFLPTIPVVVSIQGLLMGCLPYTTNYVDEKDIRRFRTLKNWCGWGGLRCMEPIFRKGYTYEKDILEHNRYFFGRTYFDKAHIFLRNSKAHYYEGEEVLRDVFYQISGSWNLDDCCRHTIFMPSGFNPIKGMHLAIEAVHLLKSFYPDIRLYVPGVFPSENSKKKLLSKITGEEYIRYAFALVKQYHLEKNVIFLPRQTAEQMAEHMKRAHVFLAPSSIDNSPNAVGEASMVGVPIVTTPVGGIPSFLHDGKAALLSPAGDAFMLAFNIKRIFDDDSLATMLSKNAHQVALRRHDKKLICKQYVDSYQQIISIHKSNK